VLCGDSLLGEPYPASAFFTTNDPQPDQDSEVFEAVDVRVPALGEDTCGYDVALIILSQNVPDSVSKPAVPRIDREVQPGELYTAVGYGLNGAGASTGSRMQLSGLTIECQPGSCGEGVESTEFRGETGICSGDSGGPALDDDGKVVGVVSRGGPDCSTPVYSTVTAWQDFIIDTAKEAAVLGGYEPAFWVTTRLSDPPVVVTPDGTAGAPSEPVGGSEGESCSQAEPCQADLDCYASDNGALGRCSARCTSTSECRDGLSCEDIGSHSICALPTGTADESSGCSVSSARAPSTALRSMSGLLLAALGTMLPLARRRRHRRRSR
jgi:hypothetical protein